jgi:hypothetical protein
VTVHGGARTFDTTYLHNENHRIRSRLYRVRFSDIEVQYECPSPEREVKSLGHIIIYQSRVFRRIRAVRLCGGMVVGNVARGN